MALTDSHGIEYPAWKDQKMYTHRITYGIVIAILGLVSLMPTQTHAAEPGSRQQERLFGMGYAQRVLWYDVERWNSHIPSGSGLPELNGPLRLHGGVFYGHLTDWLTVGLSAYGSLEEEENGRGYTHFEGSLAGFFLETHYPFLSRFYGTAGFTFSCGRFHVGSLTETGQGFSGHSDAFFAEPSFGVGYHLVKAVDIKVLWSSLFGFWVNTDWVGEANAHDVLPDGHIVSFMLTYNIPSRRGE